MPFAPFGFEEDTFIIEVEVKLSGVLTTGSIAEGEVPRWGKLVAPGVYGPNHQHFFNFRLDLDILVIAGVNVEH